MRTKKNFTKICASLSDAQETTCRYILEIVQVNGTYYFATDSKSLAKSIISNTVVSKKWYTVFETYFETFNLD